MSEGEWWYVKGGKRHGPLTTANLKNMLLSEEINANTHVWSQGMKTWTKFAEVETLQEIIKGCPPPLDNEDEHPDVSLPSYSDVTFSSQSKSDTLPPDITAGVWSRFFARQIDFVILGFVGSATLELLFPDIVDAPILNNIAAAAFFTVIVALLVEVIVMGLTGGTIGKWILGITVRRIDGTKLTMGEVFKRNMILWAHGIGLGIPLVNLFFMAKSYQIAKSGKRCRWDEELMHNVHQKEIGKARIALGISAYIILVIGLSTLDKFAEQTFSTDVTFKKAQATVWMNPLTRSRVTIYPGWKIDISRNKKKNPNTFFFKNANSIVIIGREIMNNIDIGNYIDLLNLNGKFGSLNNKKVEIDSKGMTYYALTYQKTANGIPMSIDVKVWRTTSQNYWRTIVISSINNETQRAEAQSLAARLEKTSLIEFGGRFKTIK